MKPTSVLGPAQATSSPCSGLELKGAELQAPRTLPPKCLWGPSAAAKTSVLGPLVISPLDLTGSPHSPSSLTHGIYVKHE